MGSLFRIEYWNVGAADWEVGHATMILKDAEEYLAKMAARGNVVARVIDLKDGQEFYMNGSDVL